MPPLGTRVYEREKQLPSALDQKRAELADRMHEVMVKVDDARKERRGLFSRWAGYESPRVNYPMGNTGYYVSAWLRKRALTGHVILVTQDLYDNGLGDVADPYDPVDQPTNQVLSRTKDEVILDPLHQQRPGYTYEAELDKASDALETVELISEKVFPKTTSVA